MDLQTHTRINSGLCGNLIHLEVDKAVVQLTATDEMVVDHHNLIHGGFVFGLADYAAMCAVNHPNVVLGSAECRFIHPVFNGQILVATASVNSKNGKKRTVHVQIKCEDRTVFEGGMICFVLEKHVTQV